MLLHLPLFVVLCARCQLLLALRVGVDGPPTALLRAGRRCCSARRQLSLALRVWIDGPLTLRTKLLLLLAPVYPAIRHNLFPPSAVAFNASQLHEPLVRLISNPTHLVLCTTTILEIRR